MSEVQLPSDRVPLLVQDLGFLTGLLSSHDSNLYFELSWFQDALAQIQAIPSRRAEMMKLLRDLLGTPDPSAPTDRAWYALPYDGAASCVYVVLPVDDSASNEVVGAGILKNYSKGPVNIQASLYAPLFSIPVGSPVVITGSAGNPIELVLTISGQSFSSGGITFDGLRFEGDVFFTDDVPKFTLSFTNAQPPLEVNTLDALRQTNLRDILNTVLANSAVTGWLNANVGQAPFSVGDVLVVAGIVTQSQGSYAFGSLDALAGKTAVQIAETLIAAALQKLAANTKPILAFGDGGIWVFGVADGANTNYGLRLQVPDIKIGEPATGPSLALQLGKLLTTDSDGSTWISRSDPNGTFADPGVSLTLVSVDPQNAPAFRPKVDMISIGIDVSGSGGNPLFSVNGVTLNEVELRFMLSVDFADLSKIPWGVAIHCDQLGLPLGNGLEGSPPSNPVAQNLLSSGRSGDDEPVNPAFSVSMSRVIDPSNSTSINVVLEQPSGGAADTVWLPIQRAFGPLQCSRIGVQWPPVNPDFTLTFLFDGSVHIAVLEVDLIGLSLGIPLKTPGTIGNYSLDLQGLAISYVSGPLAISGGLVKDTTATPVEYNGEALIQAAKWSISALGSYASLNGQPSLFIFARLGVTLGGPPFFFVTGLCAGFGYNRSLRLPRMEEVPSFPLLAGVADPTKIGGDNPSPAQALQAMSDWIAPAQGINWFAAGVQFTSFELVNSNAVLVVIPTGDFQAAILGVSRIKLGQTGPQFAYAELGISVILRPSDGFFGATAVLSPNSYIITENCHLTGGFAFYLWYDGDHAGDFVVTLGGYHPAFDKPAWYPDVPRLGFSWQVSSDITIQGAAYFALTPSCVMGGGSLDVEFHSGDLRAWFTAHADFLFHWKPFYYLGSVGVSIGASYKLDLLFTSVTISVELGADLEIWGPPTGGKVHIDWYILSFTVSFGSDSQGPPGYLAWQEFQALLPQNDDTSTRKIALAGLTAMDDPPLTNVIKFTISDGLISKDDDDRWLVRGDALTFSVETAWPLTEADLTGPKVTKVPPTEPGYFVAVRGMGISGVTSVMTITVSGATGNQNLGTGWTWTQTLAGVADAMWGLPLPEGQTPSTPTAITLPNRLMGIGGFTPIVRPPSGPGPIPLANLALAPIDLGNSNYDPLSATEAVVNRQPQIAPTSLATIANTISTTAVPVRAGLVTALLSFGYDPGANDAMTNLAANVNLSYPAAPMLGAPWQGVL
jgi:hypothetical protein